MAKNKGFDPVEASKIPLPGTEAPDEPEPEPEVVAAPEPPKPAVPTVKSKRWRVLETKKVSLFGQIHVLGAGTLIDESGYGPLAMERLHEQGIRLEPIDE